MSSLMFHTAKVIESTSVRLGTGMFEVGDGWKCRECLHGDSNRLCSDCRTSWLNEVRHLEYSDAFERRLNITLGVAGIVMGITALLGNARMGGLWEPGAMMVQVSEAFNTRVPQIFFISPPYRKAYNCLLILLFLLALSAILAVALVASFLMAMNPRSRRHWRHMTPGVYLVLLSQVLTYGFFIYWGATVQEIAFVIGPLMVGTGSLMIVLFMKKSREVKGEGMGVDKVHAEEKMS